MGHLSVPVSITLFWMKVTLCIHNDIQTFWPGTFGLGTLGPQTFGYGIFGRRVYGFPMKSWTFGSTPQTQNLKIKFEKRFILVFITLK